MHRVLTSTPGLWKRLRPCWVWCSVLLVGLGAWGMLTRVAVYTPTSLLDLTVDPAIRFLVTPVAGQVNVTHLRVGREVQAGEVLVELDRTEQHLQVEEERQRLLALAAHRSARQQEGAALEVTSRAITLEAQAALDEARARHHDAITALQAAQEKAQRLGPLAPLTALSPQQTVVDTARLALQRLERMQQVHAAEWRTRLTQFQRETVVLDGDIALATARLARLEHALTLRQLRAPRAGRLGAVAHPQVGAFVRAGEWLGVVGPSEAPLITATLPPGSRLLQPGQAVWLRHTAWPGVPFQPLAATVMQADTSDQDQRQRAVLRLAPEALAHWPLHPGVVWIAVLEVERVAPVILALRALRQCLWSYTPASVPVAWPGEAQ